MSNDTVVPAVPVNYQYSDKVEYLDSTVNTTTPPVVDTVPPIHSDGIVTTPPVTETLQDLTLLDLVQMLVVYSFIIAAALSAVFIFMGGISFILSGGDDEKIKRAINTIRYSIIGLIVTILSFTLVGIVGRILFQIDLFSYISFGEIKKSISRILPKADAPPSSFEIQR